MKVDGLFFDELFDRIPEETDMRPYFHAMGYEIEVCFLLDELYDDEELDKYSEDPDAWASEADIPEIAGYRLAGLYDTEDGPACLYVKPVFGMALIVEAHRDATEVPNG